MLTRRWNYTDSLSLYSVTEQRYIYLKLNMLVNVQHREKLTRWNQAKKKNLKKVVIVFTCASKYKQQDRGEIIIIIIVIKSFLAECMLAMMNTLMD